jgi:hypothetical protein
VAVFVAWLAAVAIVAAGLYAWVGEDSRPVAMRLAAACVVAIGLMQAQRSLRRSLEDEPPSRFDLERRSTPAGTKIPFTFTKLHTEVRLSLASRRHFDGVLWPRLTALAKRQDTAPLTPPSRRLGRRGPRVRELAQLISSLENQP